VAALVAAAQVAAVFVRNVANGTPWAITVLAVPIVAVAYAGILAWGQLAGARRQLVSTLRERAERAEAEQHLRAEHARQAERARIAREMHDVLAHRITLLALHAGALEVRTDLPADSVRTVGVIRDTARLALEELREVVGVLHNGGPDGPAPAAPQPGLHTIERLVAERRGAGARIALSIDVEQAAPAPGTLGRDAYRIVQEALTNAGKHAPGTATEVTVAGGPGRGLRIVVRNRLACAPAGDPMPGAGRGLLGLAERAALAGGTLVHGPDGAGDFVVDAHLAWTGPDEVGT
jgi:signal transduction histidine kinase